MTETLQPQQTETLQPQQSIEQLEKEREEVERRVAEMSAELAVLEAQEQEIFSWGESESKLAKRISDAARKKLVLPRMIRAGRVRALELRKQVDEIRAAQLEERGQEAYEVVQEARTAVRQAQENLERLQGEHGDVVSESMSLRQRIRRTNKELAELRGENNGHHG